MQTQKGWLIKQTFDNDFVHLMESMYEKYGEDVFSIQGIANKHMDIVAFSKEFFGKSGNVADVSIDGNANVKEKNILQYNYESGKAVQKLNSFYLLYKWVNRCFGEEAAAQALEKVMNGELFVNDMGSYQTAYCFAFDLRNLLSQGMNFFKGNMTIKPPRRSESFIALIIQSTAYISNQIAGAASYPDFFVVLDWFYRKEMGPKYTVTLRHGFEAKLVGKESADIVTWDRVKNQLQNFIYSMNFPFRGNQSLPASEEIIVNGKPIEIGDYVEGKIGDKDANECPVQGDSTYSFNRTTGLLEEKPIIGVIKHELEKDSRLIKYTTVMGQELVCTDRHSLFTREGLEIKEVTSEDEPTNILVPFNFFNPDKAVESVLNIPDSGGRLGIRELRLTPEIMYLIGQYIGDGSICGSRLTVSTFDDQVNQKITGDMVGLFKTHTNDRNSIEISIGKDVAHALIEIFGKGSHEKSIPRNMYTEKNILHLVGGYLDADGHARQYRGDIILSSVNMELLKSLQFILLSRGIVSRIRTHTREGFGKISDIHVLRIPAMDAHKLSNYCVTKKINTEHKLDYSRQFFDYDGVYQEIMTHYNIRGLAEHGVIQNRSRDKSLKQSDVDKLINFLDQKIKEGEDGTYKDDEEYLKSTLGVLYFKDHPGKKVVPTRTERVMQLRDCIQKLKKFQHAVPIRLLGVSEEDPVQYVYDISVEGNENFLSSSTVYAHNSAFTNLSIMDDGFMNVLFKDYKLPTPNGDFEDPDLQSAKELSKLFFEYFSHINCNEGIFTFPVMTIAISVDKDGKLLDKEFVEWAAKANCEKAFANIFQSAPTSFSSCCRLRNDLTKVADTGYQNSFGVGGLSIGCYDDKTEVLTDKGWKFFADLDRTERVCTLNMENEEIEYQKPTDYIASEYSGPMNLYKNQTIDFLVTPNHNMLAKSRKLGSLSLVQSENLKSGYNLPRIIGKYEKQNLQEYTVGSSKFSADPFYRLVGLYLGDGATYHDAEEAKHRAYEISFQIVKDRECSMVEGTLNELGIHFTKTYIKTRKMWTYRFYNKDFWEFVLPLGKCKEKYVPRDMIKDGGFSNLYNLMEGLINTDGHIGSNGTWFYTSSEKLKNNFEEISVLMGFPFHTFTRSGRKAYFKRDNRTITSGTCYEIRVIMIEKEIQRYGCRCKSTIHYSGNIYCVTVPNHIIAVKRNGTVMWCGNSHRVAGLNLPRIALLEKKDPNILEKDLELLHKILYSHRKLITHLIELGNMPLYTAGWIHLRRQYSTIGFVGAHEYVANKGLDITKQDGLKAIKDVLGTIEANIVKWQEAEKAEGNIYNLEQIPGESMCIRLCDIDTLLKHNPNKYVMYSNQYIPLVQDASIYDRVRIQGKIDSHTSGGAILHINVDDDARLSPKQFGALMQLAREQGCVYFAVNYAYSECAKGHYSVGKHEKCPACQEAIVCQFSRVVGFITPIRAWSKVRREWEFPRRVFYRNGRLEDVHV